MFNFMGKNGFVWFVGVVEDKFDPVQAGRYRVRCFGYHTDDKNEIPTDSLPWAPVLMPVTSAGVSGIGQTPKLEPGSWVMGFFLDGERAQEPMILGSLLGQPSGFSNYTRGFSDPRGVNPTLDMSPLPKRAHGVVTEHDKKSSQGGIADTKETAQPDYPHNDVKATTSGHMLEFDDTPGKERINIYHRTGSFIEIQPDGDIKINTNRMYMTVKDNYIYVEGPKDESVSGDFRLTIGGDAEVNVTGDARIQTQGDLDINCAGDMQTRVKGDYNLDVLGYVSIWSSSDAELASKAGLKLSSQSTLDLAAASDINQNSGGAVAINSGGGTIKLNENGEDGGGKETKIKYMKAEMDEFDPGLGEAEVGSKPTHVPERTDITKSGVASFSRQSHYLNTGQSCAAGGGSTYVDPSTCLSGSGIEKGTSVANELVKQGYSKEAAAGIAGNMMVETGGFKHFQELAPTAGRGGAGWLQWTGPRRNSFESWASSNNIDPRTDAANMGFLQYEMAGNTGNHWTKGYSLAGLNNQTSAAAAAKYFSDGYERPGIPHLDRRTGYANEIYSRMDGSDPSKGCKGPLTEVQPERTKDSEDKEFVIPKKPQKTATTAKDKDVKAESKEIEDPDKYWADIDKLL